MNKVTLIIILFCSTFIYSQINIRENIKTSPVDYSTISKYDSIFDFKEQEKNVDYLKFIGQELFLPPLKDKKSKGIKIDPHYPFLQLKSEYEYTADTVFILKTNYNYNIEYGESVSEQKIRIESYLEKEKQKKIKTDIYNPYISKEVGYLTPAIHQSKKTFNKNYKIINITDRNNINLREVTSNSYGIRIWMQTENKDTVFYDKSFSEREKTLSPFIIKGFYEHNLKKYKEKKLFVFKEEELDGSNEVRNPFIDINTGEVIKILPGDIWLCEEISFLNLPTNSDTLEPYYILSKDDKQIKVKLGELFENGFITFEDLKKYYNIWLLENAELIKKEKAQLKQLQKDCGKYFNKEVCDKLIKGKIEIGMTRKMILFQLGEPFKYYKLKTSSDLMEVFYYGNTIVYFRDGLIVQVEQLD